MSFSRQEPDNSNQESSPHQQQRQPHHLHSHQPEEAHLQPQQYPHHQHDNAGHQQEEILAVAFDSYPPYMQQAYRTQLNRARQQSAGPLDITYQSHENVSPFDPSTLSNPVGPTQQLAEDVASTLVALIASHSDPAEAGISGKYSCISIKDNRLIMTIDLSDPYDGMDLHAYDENDEEAYPPDIGNTGAYPDVHSYPTITTQPPLITPMEYGMPSVHSSGPQEQRHKSGPAFSEKSRGKLPERGDFEVRQHSRGVTAESIGLASKPLNLMKGYNPGAANAARRMGLQQYSSAQPTVHRSNAQPFTTAVRRTLMAPGPEYHPMHPGAQVPAVSSLQSLPFTTQQLKKAAAAGQITHPPLPHNTSLSVDFDDLEYRKLHRRMKPRDDARGQKVDFTCVLLTHPDVVDEWKQVGRTNPQIQLLVQYYQQVSQVHGYRKVDALMDGRLEAAQDPLDHRILFASSDEIPPRNFQLQAGPWESTSRGQAQSMFMTGRPFELVTYRRPHESIPVGATVEFIARTMINHHQHEHIDAFLQHGIPGPQIWRTMTDEQKQLLTSLGVTTDEASFLHNRLRRRQKDLVNQYGSNAVLDFYESGIKLRDRGNLEVVESKASQLQRDIPPLRLRAQLQNASGDVGQALVVNPGMQGIPRGGEASAAPMKHFAEGGRAAQITGTHKAHTSALSAHGNFETPPLPHNRPASMQADFRQSQTQDVHNQPTSAGVQSTIKSTKHSQATFPQHSHQQLQPSEAAPSRPVAMDNNEIDPALLQPVESSQVQLSEKAKGKRPAVEAGNIDLAMQSATQVQMEPSEKALGKRPAVETENPALQDSMQSAQPQPSEKALGMRPASSGVLNPRLQALGARPAQMKGGKRGPTKGRKGKATQAGPQKSGPELLAGPTAMKEASQPKQDVAKHRAERGERFLQQMGLAGIVQPANAPGFAPPLNSAPAPGAVGLPVFDNGQRVSGQAQAEGLSHADYSHMQPSKRPAYIITDAERQALVADANWRVQTRQPPVNPNYAPRVVAADVPVSIQDLATVLPNLATIERWKREGDEEFERRALADAEWEAAREDQGGQEQVADEEANEGEPEEVLKAPGDTFNPEEAP